MTRKAKISFLIVVWSIVAVQMCVNYRQHMKSEQDTVTAFSVVREEGTKETIQGYGKFGDMELSVSNKKKMLENLAQKLGITDGYTYSGSSGDGYEKTILTKNGKHAVTILQIISMEQEGGEPEQYIAMSIATEESVEQGIALYQKVKRVYDEIGVEAQVSLEVEATGKGNQVSMEKGGIPDQIFRAIHAKKVDTVKENGIYTVYGYTRLEDRYLVLNKKKVNIQVVMRYDQNADQTYIKIGVPIVNSSY